MFFVSFFKCLNCFRLRKDFKKLLEDLGCVTPGKNIQELKVLFLGRECFENLPEKDVIEIYELHQREIIQKAKKSFQVSYPNWFLGRIHTMHVLAVV
jgi:hypothetical protein